MLAVYILIIIDVYLQRFRHRIMGGIYPDRAKLRAKWLHGQIIRRRNTFRDRKRKKIYNFRARLKAKAVNCSSTTFKR